MMKPEKQIAIETDWEVEMPAQIVSLNLSAASGERAQQEADGQPSLLERLIDRICSVFTYGIVIGAAGFSLWHLPSALIWIVRACAMALGLPSGLI